MRTIKFRGKRKDNNEWVYGEHISAGGITYIFDENESFRTPQDPDFETSFIEVVPETIGQFTGLYDKNGKEIWEGDIIKWKDGHGKETIDYVKFTKGVFMLHYINFSIFYYPETEIIGNIHENPELLEQ